MALILKYVSRDYTQTLIIHNFFLQILNKHKIYLILPKFRFLIFQNIEFKFQFSSNKNLT